MTTAQQAKKITYSLVGDIGGTNARLQLISFSKEDEHPTEIQSSFYRSRDFASLSECIRKFLAEYKDTEKYPQNATLAVAGAPYEGKVCLPNLDWPIIDEAELSKEFQISPFCLINDFVAIGYSVLNLKNEEIIDVASSKKGQTGTKIVTGPGTGMGECLIQSTPNEDGSMNHTVFGTEGGHKNFAPTSKIEWEYLNFVLDEQPEIKEKIGYLSTEKAFCGPGIPTIYRFFCKKDEVIHETLTSEEIIQRGLSKSDKQCLKTLELFTTLYAKEISNFALNSLPYGGIYLVGGLTNAVADYMINDPESPFKAGYFSKGKVINSVLERFPIYVVKTVELGLRGTFVKAQKDAF
jgi:glucokinase